MRHLLIHSALICFLCLGTGVAQAQEMPTWAAPTERMEPAPVDARRVDLPSRPPPVPVDGGLMWLAFAGVGYAARRLLYPDGA